MRLVFWTLLLSLFATLVGASLGHCALAQTELPQIIPEMPLDTDVNEVDDVPDRDEATADKAGSQNGGRLESEFLSYSPLEVRSRFKYGVSLAGGPSMPWQSYSLAGDDQIKPDLAVGLYLGGGTFTLTGNTVDGRAYDISMTARGFGILARYWIPHIERLSVELALGYSLWNGSVTPHGSDDQITDPSQKLGSSFNAAGFVQGLAFNLQWLWEGGFYLQWTPIGIQATEVLQESDSLSSDLVKSAVKHDLQRGRVYGLIDLKVGYYF